MNTSLTLPRTSFEGLVRSHQRGFNGTQKDDCDRLRRHCASAMRGTKDALPKCRSGCCTGIPWFITFLRLDKQQDTSFVNDDGISKNQASHQEITDLVRCFFELNPFAEDFPLQNLRSVFRAGVFCRFLTGPALYGRDGDVSETFGVPGPETGATAKGMMH